MVGQPEFGTTIAIFKCSGEFYCWIWTGAYLFLYEMTRVIEERLYDVLLSFSNIAALIAGTLLLDWHENLIKRDIFLQCVFLY